MTRMKAARRAAPALLASLLVLALTGCTSPAEVVGSMLSTPSVDEARQQQKSAKSAALASPAILTDGVLTVGIKNSATAPMLIDDQEALRQGYAVDVAYAVADQLGLTTSFVTVNDAASTSEAGCDIILGAKSGEAGDMTVVGSYAESAVGFFHKGEPTIVRSDALNGAKVGVQGDSTSQRMLERSNLTLTTQTYPNINAAFEALEAGEVDYVLCDAYTGAYVQTFYDDLAFVGTLDTPTSIGVALDASNTDLQNAVTSALDAISSNGVDDVLHRKWLGSLGVLTSSSRIQGITLSASSHATNAGATGDTATSSSLSGGATAGSNAVSSLD